MEHYEKINQFDEENTISSEYIHPQITIKDA